MKIFALLLAAVFACKVCSAESLSELGSGDIEQISSGHRFLEGPAVDKSGRLYFTDIPKNEILYLNDEGDVEVFSDASNHANGLMFNAAGEMVACEMDGQLVAWDVDKKERRVIASEYDGKRFNAPNDLVIDRQGGIYFTDPHFRAPQPLPQGVQGVYYVAPNGSVTRVVEDLPAPNGILLSLDERTLYVLPSDTPKMMAYDVMEPGKLANEREFCHLRNRANGRSGADGAAMDEHGNLYITSRIGVQVYSPVGELLGIIDVPQVPSNVTFDLNRNLYITARSSLYKVLMKASGHRYGE